MAAVLAWLAVLALGLLSGAMLLIAVAIAPYWASLEPAAFANEFRASSVFLGRVMLPLGVGSTTLALLAAVVARPVSSPHFRWLAAAALLAVGVALVYPLYFGPANAALASGTLEPSAIGAELARWRGWHWARTIAGLAAFVAALGGLLAAPGSRR